MAVRLRRDWDGWLSGAAAYGLVGALIPYVAGSALGWAGLLLGLLPAALIRERPLPDRWSRTIALLRGIWSVGAMGLSLGLCARGLVYHLFPDWNIWGVAIPLAALLFRGGLLTRVQRERAGKLLFFLLALMGGVLFLATVSSLRRENLAVTGWGDLRQGARAFLISAGAASALVPVGGRVPPLLGDGLGTAAVVLTTGAEGPALASRLAYPYLALCDAAAFSLRLSPLGGAVWACGEFALLLSLLSRLPEEIWWQALGCVGALALQWTLPWSEPVLAAFLIGGAALAYLPPLLGTFTRTNHI